MNNIPEQLPESSEYKKLIEKCKDICKDALIKFPSDLEKVEYNSSRTAASITLKASAKSENWNEAERAAANFNLALEKVINPAKHTSDENAENYIKVAIEMGLLYIESGEAFLNGAYDAFYDASESAGNEQGPAFDILYNNAITVLQELNNYLSHQK